MSVQILKVRQFNETSLSFTAFLLCRFLIEPPFPAPYTRWQAFLGFWLLAEVMAVYELFHCRLYGLDQSGVLLQAWGGQLQFRAVAFGKGDAMP